MVKLPLRIGRRTLWISQKSLSRLAARLVKASPGPDIDPDWLKDLAAAGAYTVAKMVADNNIPDAMLGAYTVGRLIEIDKELSEKGDIDTSEEAGYWTTIRSSVEKALRTKRVSRAHVWLGSQDYVVWCSKRLAEGWYASPELFIVETLLKKSYIKKVPGHKGSDGELREWCIFKHGTHKLLQCYKTKKEAEEALQRMHIFNNSSVLDSVLLKDRHGRVWGVFRSEEDANQWLATYIVVLNAIHTIANGDWEPENVSGWLKKVSEVAEGLMIHTSPDQLRQDLANVTKIVESVLEWALQNGVAVEISGTLTIYSPQEEDIVVKMISEYKDQFNTQQGFSFYPVFESKEMSVYSFRAESLQKKSTADITPALVDGLKSLVTSLELPTYFSCEVGVKNKEGEVEYTLYIPGYRVTHHQKEGER